MIKIITVIGARPQFVKAALVSHAIQSQNVRTTTTQITEILVHTGQHYDAAMSQVFFEEMGIPAPAYNLEVGSGSHAVQTGQIMIRLEQILVEQRPEIVLVYGDTNSTIAAALAAPKLGIPLGHVEAGLRSYNRTMPEEINRITTDRVSTLLFCPTRTSMDLLRQEGITQGVHLTGDVMLDAALHFARVAEQRSNPLERFHLSPKAYYLATVHRPVNADNPEHMACILRAFSHLPMPVVFPVHPRTRKMIDTLCAQGNLTYDSAQLRFIEPVGYLEMLLLEKYARTIITDSGGVQKEAYFFRVPCVTLRDETEWVETVQLGWNVLCAIQEQDILEKIRHAREGTWLPVFGDGTASAKIVELVQQHFR